MVYNQSSCFLLTQSNRLVVGRKSTFSLLWNFSTIRNFSGMQLLNPPVCKTEEVQIIGFSKISSAPVWSTWHSCHIVQYNFFNDDFLQFGLFQCCSNVGNLLWLSDTCWAFHRLTIYFKLLFRCRYCYMLLLLLLLFLFFFFGQICEVCPSFLYEITQWRLCLVWWSFCSCENLIS